KQTTCKGTTIEEDTGKFPSSLVQANLSGQKKDPLAGCVVDVPGLTYRNEDIMSESWRQHRKHVFVLSEAGKPIYSRYGNEEALSSTMGVMMALVSFVQAGADMHTVVFLQKDPLVFVSVSATHQSEQQLRSELLHVYHQIVSMLMQASINRIFERQKNFDLARLLFGSGRTSQYARLKPNDLHLLLIRASSAFQAGETWTPICLPLFNQDCYFYAYVAYLDPPECTLCLVLLSTDKECVANTQLYIVDDISVANLMHFLYKPSKVLDHHRNPEMEVAYRSQEERIRLLDLFHNMHYRILSTSRPLKLIYILQVSSKFEMYTCFTKLVTKKSAVSKVTKLLRWILPKYCMSSSFVGLVCFLNSVKVLKFM
uniref:Vacuolar fusion protein MON1 homolog n=1 Tax=Cyprinus carpio TaxID=7962 RepID=A0A8C2KAG7_CYPCA